MALQLDTPSGGNHIHRIEPGCVWVNGQAWRESLLVPWDGEVRPWGVARFETLQARDFEALLDYRPELVLFASGTRLRFAPPALLRPLMAAGVGLDSMDLSAACRTFAVLASEGRRVLAALLVESEPPAQHL
jgi:uncharacterized protein